MKKSVSRYQQMHLPEKYREKRGKGVRVLRKGSGNRFFDAADSEAQSVKSIFPKRDAIN